MLGTEKQPRCIMIRVSIEEYEKIKELAARELISVSSYVRRSCLLNKDYI